MTFTPAGVVPILMYHSVAESAHRIDLPFTVRPGELRCQLDALHGVGVTTLTVAEYAASIRSGRLLPARTVVITIDDGYADTAALMVPSLLERGFTATVFVTTGAVGRVVRRSRMISWSQLRELHQEGFEIGAHTHHHRALDTVRPSDAKYEMAHSRAVLEDALSSPVPSFAYPYGYWTSRLRGLAAEVGYQSACAAKNALSHPSDDLYALSRIVVKRGTSAQQLCDAVAGRTRDVATSPRTFQRLAWRLARRAGAFLRHGHQPRQGVLEHGALDLGPIGWQDRQVS